MYRRRCPFDNCCCDPFRSNLSCNFPRNSYQGFGSPGFGSPWFGWSGFGYGQNRYQSRYYRDNRFNQPYDTFGYY